MGISRVRVNHLSVRKEWVDFFYKGISKQQPILHCQVNFDQGADRDCNNNLHFYKKNKEADVCRIDKIILTNNSQYIYLYFECLLLLEK